ncbi:hypothetical protein QE152_g10060 [Popillia japonica]|uniref:Uncharacterized protein n=1 Tax=Popillia japonica TaxID=7064 RepID=A0AAW1LSL7_POPJA
MATAARFAAGDNSPPTPAPASTPPAQSQTTQLIVLPASLHQTTASSAIVNGVPVIDVSALEQAADSSNESSATTDHQADSHETEAIEQTSPHFITVTVASDSDTVASHQGYHVQYVEPEVYASQANASQAQMAYPVYTVGESGTLYASQGQYYAAHTGATATASAVGYATPGGHYLVQQTVDTEALIASTRNSPQTTNAETNFVATAAVHATSSSSGQINEEVGSTLGHATRVSPATFAC